MIPADRTDRPIDLIRQSFRRWQAHRREHRYDLHPLIPTPRTVTEADLDHLAALNAQLQQEIDRNEPS